VLYAWVTSPDKSIDQTEKELFFSLQKTYDLYHHMMATPVDVADAAVSLMELRKRKHFPTPEDLNPNTRFVQNPLINILRNHAGLKRYVEDVKICADWDDTVRKLYKELTATDFYAAYMSAPELPENGDRKVMEQLMSEVVLQSDDVNAILEEQSIFWNDDLDFVISMVIKTFKRLLADPEQPLLPFFKDDDDEQFARILLRKCLFKNEDLKNQVEQLSQNWDVERIAMIDKLIIQMGIVEMMSFPSIPGKVTINECIELSKYYSTEKSSIFVNGILDKALKTLESEGKLEKTGRGLME
jgi:N utilization substance protein B